MICFISLLANSACHGVAGMQEPRGLSRTLTLPAFAVRLRFYGATV